MTDSFAPRPADFVPGSDCLKPEWCTRNGSCIMTACRHNPRFVPTAEEALLAKLYLAKLYPDMTRRYDESEKFWRVEEILAKLEGKSDAYVAAYLAFMVEDAPPVARSVVAAFVERIKAARALKPSQ